MRTNAVAVLILRDARTRDRGCGTAAARALLRMRNEHRARLGSYLAQPHYVVNRRSQNVVGAPARPARIHRHAYCCGIPAASRTAFQRANSRAMCWPNASAVEPRTTTPAVVKRFCTASSPRLSLMTLLSLAMISRGTPRGANTPY